MKIIPRDLVRTNRYSPHAAVSIDSFDNTVPSADRYPGLDTLYKGLPGSGSKQVHIEGCAIMGWHVGIMLNSSSGNSQGDGVFVRHNLITNCTYAVAIGQSQSRGVDIRDNEFANHKVVFDTITFGQSPWHASACSRRADRRGKIPVFMQHRRRQPARHRLLLRGALLAGSDQRLPVIRTTCRRCSQAASSTL